MTKRYVAETYAQSAVEAMIELREAHDIDPAAVESIDLDTFAGAKLIIGGGEGSRYEVETRAQADHSLPYMLAAALVDGELTVDSYEPERIRREEVQSLLGTVEVREDDRLTEEFENGLLPAVIDVELADGTIHHVERDAFRGHPTEPMTWDDVEAKFRSVTADAYGRARQTAVIDTVRALDEHSTEQLVAMLD
jgi:2-methylcitrate dehydratase